MSSKKLTPFGYIRGPYYTYELTRWVEPNLSIIETIYVGRGRARRAMNYYQFKSRGGGDLYFSPKGHNPLLNLEIAAVRKTGREIGVIAHDHGKDLAACKLHEKELIQKYGRRDKGTGTLFNKNSGG